MQVRYLGLVEKLKELMVDPVYSLNAAVYTELSDVEAEINGLITYDRQVGLHHTPDGQASCQDRPFGSPQRASVMETLGWRCPLHLRLTPWQGSPGLGHQ